MAGFEGLKPSGSRAHRGIPNTAVCSPRRGACRGPGAAGSVSVTLMPAGILGCGTAHNFVLGKAVTDEGRAAPQGAMVPQARAETDVPSIVRAKWPLEVKREFVPLPRVPGVQLRAVSELEQSVTRSQN